MNTIRIQSLFAEAGDITYPEFLNKLIRFLGKMKAKMLTVDGVLSIDVDTAAKFREVLRPAPEYHREHIRIPVIDGWVNTKDIATRFDVGVGRILGLLVDHNIIHPRNDGHLPNTGYEDRVRVEVTVKNIPQRGGGTGKARVFEIWVSESLAETVIAWMKQKAFRRVPKVRKLK